MRTENNSLSLTLAEAEEMARGLSGSKKRSGSGLSGRWFFSKKNKSSGSLTRGQRRRSSNTPPSSNEEGSPQPDESQLQRSSGSDSGSNVGTNRVSESGSTRASESDATRVSESGSVRVSESGSTRASESGSEVVAAAVAVAATASGSVGEASSSSVSTNEREMTPGSILSSEFESATEDDAFLQTGNTSRPVDVQATPIHIRPAERGGDTTIAPAEGDEESLQSGEGLRERQSTIVHASNLSVGDMRAASRARTSAHKRRSRQRLDTDERTNQSEGAEQGWMCTIEQI